MNKLKLKPLEGVEDIDYINVSTQTAGVIGRKLAYTTVFNPTPTWIGKITSLRTAMDFLTIPGYPVKLLTKTKITTRDINKIPRNKVGVVNYWAIVTGLISDRILNDKKLLTMLLNLKSDVVFTSFNTKKHTTFGIDSFVTTYNHDIARYVEVIGNVVYILKNNKKEFWDIEIGRLINATKVDKAKNLFDGVPFEISFDDSKLANV